MRPLILLCCLSLALAASEVTISHETEPPRPDQALDQAPGDLKDKSISAFFTIDHIILIEPRQLPAGTDMDHLKDNVIRSCENGAFIDKPLELADKQQHQRPAFMGLLLEKGRIACFYGQLPDLPFAIIFMFNDRSMRAVYYDSIFPIRPDPTPAPPASP